MSLETALAENTAALLKMTAILEASNVGRAEVLAKIEALPAAEAKKTRTTKTAEAVVETKAEKPAAETPKATSVMTVAELQTAFGDYMNVTDTDDREKRKAFVKSILAKLDAVRVGDIPEDKRSVALGYITSKLAEEKAKVEAEAEAEDDDLL